jgi:hypothetical protein
MNNLEIKEYPINENIKYLGDLEPFKSEGIKTNTILFKTLPGFGATYWEISFKMRNSIIIVPNVPAIKGKAIKHPEILAVHKGITISDIVKYLKNDILPKKIVTTPEGYSGKVMQAISRISTFNLKNDFFLLLDECDKMITDVKYRGKIIAPIDDFFLFDKKAMVSATAIEPSDKRFKDQDFKIIKLVPQFDYRKDIDLISTNNVLLALDQVLKKPSKHPVFIFLNSIITIKAIIDYLDIENKSKIFCSEDSVRLLKKLQFENAQTDLGNFAKINFLTSRCYSSLDIDLDYKPDVIMVTDVFHATHTMIDPKTDAVQISGRFRKKADETDKKTVNSLTHITNYKSDIKYSNREQSLSWINSSYKTHLEWQDKLRHESEQGAKENYEQALKNSLMKDFIRLDGSLESFMVDNYINQQRVRSYYDCYNHLYIGYLESSHFKVTLKRFPFPVTDASTMNLALAKTKKAIAELVCDHLNEYTSNFDHQTFRDYHPDDEIKKLKIKHPSIVEAYFLLGAEKMKEMDFAMHKIKTLVDSKKENLKRFETKMLSDIYKEFGNEFPKTFLETDIYNKLDIIYKRHRFYPKKLEIADIDYYYNNVRTNDKNNVKARKLTSKKSN